MAHRCGVSGKDRCRNQLSHKHLHQRITVPEPLADGALTTPWRTRNPFCQCAISRAPGAAQDGWIGDSCMGHGIALLQREHPNIGLINPIFSRFQARDAQLRAINAGDPFKDTNKVIMLPLHVANNHWCGAVLDFGVKVEGSCCLTRSNSPSRNTTMNAKHSCRTYLVKYVRSYRSRDTQPYVSSCGPAVLMFFECLLTGITPFTW
ncbi:hypothetical protein JG688_00015952 [Phytophthora aleatoria]|uniref:Ubiquitin-like protease family profile domain-containing protein n=1 Tax=Phytophthora aleatoria TaxID=2496075 RepID=A0A8J5ISI4_9STRA|nr:hypothetical protein JG688_00015952 [Phytophthora aleatoria]